MNNNKQQFKIASVGGQFKQHEDGKMKAGSQIGLEEQHLPWGEERVMFVCKGRVRAAGQALPSQAATRNSLGSFYLALLVWGSFSFLFPSFIFFTLFPCSPSFPGALVFCFLAAFTPKDPGTCLQHHIDWSSGISSCCSSGASLHQCPEH